MIVYYTFTSAYQEYFTYLQIYWLYRVILLNKWCALCNAL